MNSGEAIPPDYQKIPYRMIFDVKYGARHKERPVAGGNQITSATSAMSRFNKLPIEGQLKAVKRILCYLRPFLKGELLLIPRIEIILSFLLRIILIGKISIQKLKKKFQITSCPKSSKVRMTI
jgi:hypothetical protein